MLAVGQPHPAGVNEQVSALLPDHRQSQALINTTIFCNTPTAAVIAGSEATLTIPGRFYQPGPMTLASADGQVLGYDEPQIAHEVLHFQAAEVARCAFAGVTQSPPRTWAESIATLQVIDEIRRQLGIVFNAEC